MLTAMRDRFPILSRAVLSGILAFLFFGILELVLADDAWSELYAGDAHSFWTLRPSVDLESVPHPEESSTFAVKTNTSGLRDGMVPASSPWVLALGCSTTFGWGVDGSESWPQELERVLGVPVHNAGIPGHSTEQGRRVAGSLFKAQPDIAILGWGLRDAQLTTTPDAQRRPSTFPRNTAVFRWLSQKLRTPVYSRGHQPRVSAERFAANLKAIIAAAETQGVQVLLLDMTGRSETPSHGEVLAGLDRPLVVPRLADSMYFENDPIHLTAAGNRALAQLLAPSVSALLSREPGD
jgi:lysophospholipase L1-like esterase